MCKQGLSVNLHRVKANVKATSLSDWFFILTDSSDQRKVSLPRSQSLKVLLHSFGLIEYENETFL